MTRDISNNLLRRREIAARRVNERAISLSDQDIRLALALGSLIIDPLEDDAVGPNSIDLQVVNIEGAEDPAYRLQPGASVNAEIRQRIHLPKGHAAYIETRGSVARAGLIVVPRYERTRGLGDIPVAFDGHLPVTIQNMHHPDSGVEVSFAPGYQDFAVCQLFIGKVLNQQEIAHIHEQVAVEHAWSSE